ncbi:Y-family DNA polymerase [Chishuiella sp.]|uniref:Y-family DNA polymerase n=1 Tax=Chishuiella sp. TaxID=1969467 RepID=UPI0028ADAF33|nr:Y-family DNA polymerase [Chishuiella sp.]
MYALVDCNNFYASCERVFAPSLNGKPIVVLSNNDGCVIARSEEAKNIGIPMGAPAFKYEEIFKKKSIHVFSSNYSLYADMSNRVTNVIRTYCPTIEVYSIDESFLFFDGFEKYNLKNYCDNLKQSIYDFTKIPVCIGIAPTKVLAKAANRIAKKFKEHHQGVYSINSFEKINKAIKWLKIEDVWGIGRRLSKRLLSIGIKTAWDFTNLTDEYIQKNFSVLELKLKKELLGESVLKLEDVKRKKSIVTTRSFEYDVSDYEYLKERISTFAVSCAEKLRKENSKCNIITVYIATNRFDKEKPYYSKTLSAQLPFYTNSSIVLSKNSLKILDKIALDKYKYKRAGVMVSAIIPSNERQLNLFNEENPKHELLMNTIDHLNKKIRGNKVKLGSQDLKKTWKMKQERLSPKYTTCWKDILKVN